MHARDTSWHKLALNRKLRRCQASTSRGKCILPANLPSTKEALVCDVEASVPSTTRTEPTRSPEEEARDILATAAKNQAEDGPNTRRAAIRAYKYLRAIVNLTNMVP